MIKAFITALALTMAINAEEGYVLLKNNTCIKDAYPQEGGGYCYTKVANDKKYCGETLNRTSFSAGYLIYRGDCYLNENLEASNLEEDQWNYSMAMIAHSMGITLLFFTSFLSIRIANQRA